jgi:hypothetical protein
MRYVLSLRGSAPVSPAQASASLAELNGQMALFAELARELRAGGELVVAHALAGPEHARWVPAAPPAEAFLVAYWVVDCDAPERAMEIAEHLGARPGFCVEIRPVQKCSGEEM